MWKRDIPAIWRTDCLKEWPPAPKTISFSVLREIEACPRRWALMSARYPEIWTRGGYPEKFQIETTIGRIVHDALEKMVATLANAGCTSVRDPQATAVLKELGGYTKTVNECIECNLAEYKDNPRVSKLQGIITRTIQSKASEVRESLQIIVSRIRLKPRDIRQKSEEVDKLERRPLRSGSYTEVRLLAAKFGWTGIADLINISDNECEIVDFKTGEPHDEHFFQLRVYSLLWTLDSKINPAARLANKLTLSYTGGDVEVSVPSSYELHELEDELSERSRLAFETVTSMPPESRPGMSTCRYCKVRQICDDYWRTTIQRSLAKEPTEEGELRDFELTIIGQHGPSSWDTVVEVARDLEKGNPLLLRTPLNEPELHVGDQIRILDVHFVATEGQETQIPVATMTNWSEAFFVPH